MNKKYEMIFLVAADTWEQVTPSRVERLFEEAENAGYKLGSFKNWLLKQPVKESIKGRIEEIYNDFMECY
jgi:hypothetical protein